MPSQTPIIIASKVHKQREVPNHVGFFGLSENQFSGLYGLSIDEDVLYVVSKLGGSKNYKQRCFIEGGIGGAGDSALFA
jgi:hypothetical protein